MNSSGDGWLPGNRNGLGMAGGACCPCSRGCVCKTISCGGGGGSCLVSRARPPGGRCPPPGGGPPAGRKKDPTVEGDLLALLVDETGGDPMKKQKWGRLGLNRLRELLGAHGH